MDRSAASPANNDRCFHPMEAAPELDYVPWNRADAHERGENDGEISGKTDYSRFMRGVIDAVR